MTIKLERNLKLHVFKKVCLANRHVDQRQFIIFTCKSLFNYSHSSRQKWKEHYVKGKQCDFSSIKYKVLLSSSSSSSSSSSIYWCQKIFWLWIIFSIRQVSFRCYTCKVYIILIFGFFVWQYDAMYKGIGLILVRNLKCRTMN